LEYILLGVSSPPNYFQDDVLPPSQQDAQGMLIKIKQTFNPIPIQQQQQQQTISRKQITTIVTQKQSFATKYSTLPHLLILQLQLQT
jgi:hypothetical protein